MSNANVRKRTLDSDDNQSPQKKKKKELKKPRKTTKNDSDVVVTPSKGRRVVTQTSRSRYIKDRWTMVLKKGTELRPFGYRVMHFGIPDDPDDPVFAYISLPLDQVYDEMVRQHRFEVVIDGPSNKFVTMISEMANRQGRDSDDVSVWPESTEDDPIDVKIYTD